ncbi:MAG: hypothetical protein ACLFQR_12925 [Desulfovibrionales bacterium]
MNKVMENVLREVNEEGEVVLKDGTKWLVDPHEVNTAFHWPEASRIRAEFVDRDTNYPWELTEVVHGSTVRAMKVED